MKNIFKTLKNITNGVIFSYSTFFIINITHT